MMRFHPWQCPECGEPARGTLETLPGVARLCFDENGRAEWSGDTEICWDGQRTIRDSADRVTLLGSCGHSWPAVMEAT